MTKDLPDFQSLVVEEAVEAGSFRGGADAAKPASPVSKDVYFATDTKVLYVCVTDGAWTGFDASMIVQGILTLYANLAGGGYKLTNIGAPTASTDAARKLDVDTVDAKLDDISTDIPVRAIDTQYQNSTKLRMVIVTVRLDAGESVEFIMDSTSPPTTSYTQPVSVTTRTDLPITIIVPPSWYYKVITNAGSPTITNWAEQDLH